MLKGFEQNISPVKSQITDRIEKQETGLANIFDLSDTLKAMDKKVKKAKVLDVAKMKINDNLIEGLTN